MKESAAVSGSRQLPTEDELNAIREGVSAVVTRFGHEDWLARDEGGAFRVNSNARWRRGRSPARASFLAPSLRANGLVGFLLDQNRPLNQGVFVQFFGRPASTSPGLAVLASQAQAPVIPVFLSRRPDGTHHLQILPLIEPPPDRGPATVLRYTQLYTTVTENAIRRHPDQWTWIHRRWKNQPLPGDAIATPESGPGVV